MMRKTIVFKSFIVLVAAVLTLSMFCQPVYAGKAKDSKAVSNSIELGTPFRDNAILQQQMKVPVWGWSRPGTKVTVEFAGQKKSAKTDRYGKWMVKLDELKASFHPREIVITEDTGKTVTLKNILVGEVWLASGQSNMQWIASKCNVGRVLQKQIQERVEAGKEMKPVIREALVTNYYAALHPIEHAQGEWSVNEDQFSAIAYAFAYKLFSELKVPIGILNCSFSSTEIQAWTPREGFATGKDEYTKAIYQKLLETDPATKEHRAAWNEFYNQIEESLKKGEEISTKTPGNMKGNRDATWLFNARLNPMIPYAIRGGIWNQGYANIGQGFTYYNNLHSLTRGWRILWDRPELPIYFHQFYSPGKSTGSDNSPTVGEAADMRLGTWLARDIENAGMASQIDITGAIHYNSKTIPGFRLALHALKNQYGKDVVADGPMFKSYAVKGDKLIVEFEHAEGGIVVGVNPTDSKQIVYPKVIENGEDQVDLFYIADSDRVWYKADIQIDGDKVILSSPKVKFPRGVSYATGGVGSQVNLYNKAMLPMTPFIYYDQKLVTKETWPDDLVKVDGVVPDPSSVGLLYEYRKMPILSTQFRDNAVLQADQPVTIWGSAIHDWGYEADGDAVIKFSFGDIKKTIPVKPGMRQWQVTLPAMKASGEPKTLKLRLEIDGKLAHERVAENIVFGDVYYVSSPWNKLGLGKVTKSDGIVRVMKRKCKRSMFKNASPYSISVSTTPKNRFASFWADAEDDLPGAIANRIASKTNRPVGVIYMQGENTIKVDGKSKSIPLELKHWIKYEYLKDAPTLIEDYKQLASINPGNKYYEENVRSYISAWKKYWGEYITEMIKTKDVPDGIAWGSYPTLSGSVTTKASQAYNIMVHSFGPASLKGIIFFCDENMFEGGKAASFGSEFSALANGWKSHFGGDPYFIYTIPSKDLAAGASKPDNIKGKSKALVINNWADIDEINKLIDMAVEN